LGKLETWIVSLFVSSNMANLEVFAAVLQRKTGGCRHSLRLFDHDGGQCRANEIS